MMGRRARLSRSINGCLVALALLAVGAVTAVAPSSPASGQTSIPDEGLPAEFVPFDIDNNARNLAWGVQGLAPHESEPFIESPVWAITDIGDTIYIGGKFAEVSQGPGGQSVAQAYLAAFDIITGEWRSTFTPTLNGVVYELEALPDGRLLVGGDFTSVDGAPNTTGFAVLDPVTGVVDPTWSAHFELNWNPFRARVNSIDVQGDWVYVAGDFSHVTGDGRRIYAQRAVRLDIDSGRPDNGWSPRVSGGKVWQIDVADAGDIVWMAGDYLVVSGQTTHRGVVQVDTDTGAPRNDLGSWMPNDPGNRDWQQAIVDDGERVYIGGSQHNAHIYDRDDMSLIRSHVTDRSQPNDLTGAGGDIQAIAVVGDIAFYGCHCFGYVYVDSNTWRPYDGPYSGIENVTSGVFAVDRRTGDVIDSFQPWIATSPFGEGAWALHADRDNCLWIGGDYETGPGGRWVGGFTKHCPVGGVDGAAPSQPQDLSATRTATDITLTWSASTDNRGVVEYEVLEHDSVVGTTTGTDFVHAVTGDRRYFVRAIDARGNRSATTPVLALLSGPPVVTDPGDQQSTVGDNVSLRIDATDPEGAALTYVAAGLPDGLTINPNTGRITGIASARGDFTVTITVSDGDADADVTFDWMVRDPVAVVFSDDFEAAGSGWTRDAAGTDTATTGYWEIATPDQTTSGGAIMQRGDTTSGISALVTHAAAGGSAGAFDVDNGTTTSRSDQFTLPDSPAITATLDYYLGHRANGRAGDTFRVSLVGDAGTVVIVDEAGDGTVRAAEWTSVSVDVTALAGQDVSFLVEATDDSPSGALWEAGIDTITIEAEIVGPGPDSEAPTVPQNLAATTTDDSVTLTWDAATDNVGVASYDVYRDDRWLGWTTSTTYTDGGLALGETHSYRVAAKDAADNVSAWTPRVTATAGSGNEPDNQPPSIPQNLSATTGPGSITIAWDPSTDNIAVASYDIYRDEKWFGWTTMTTFTDAGLAPGERHAYRVVAKDTSGNTSQWTPRVAANAE